MHDSRIVFPQVMLSRVVLRVYSDGLFVDIHHNGNHTNNKRYFQTISLTFLQFFHQFWSARTSHALSVLGYLHGLFTKSQNTRGRDKTAYPETLVDKRKKTFCHRFSKFYELLIRRFSYICPTRFRVVQCVRCLNDISALTMWPLRPSPVQFDVIRKT